MKIQIIKEPHVSVGFERSWSDYVSGHQSGNIFQGKEFFMLCCQTPGYRPVAVLALDEKENVCGVMQGVVMTEKGHLAGYLSARAIAWGGPLANDDDTCALLVEEYEKELGNDVIYSQIRPVGKETNINYEILLKSGFKREHHLDIFNYLSEGEAVMISKIHKERKRNIGRARNKGVEVRFAENDIETEAAVAQVLNLYKSIGLPAPPQELLSCAKGIMGEAVKIFIAVYDNKIIGSRFVLCYRDMVYDWYAGSDPGYHNKYVNDLLPWEVMLWASRNGFRIFDFGGAGNPLEKYGVRDFKLRYGGELAEVSRFTHVHRPVLMFFGRQGIRLYRIIKKVFK